LNFHWFALVVGPRYIFFADRSHSQKKRLAIELANVIPALWLDGYF